VISAVDHIANGAFGSSGSSLLDACTNVRQRKVSTSLGLLSAHASRPDERIDVQVVRKIGLFEHGCCVGIGRAGGQEASQRSSATLKMLRRTTGAWAIRQTLSRGT
jgi:hypothetical protein